MVQLYAGNVLLLILIAGVGYTQTQFLMGCDLGTALGQRLFSAGGMYWRHDR